MISCICGSTTLKLEMLKQAEVLTLKGDIVLLPLVFSHYDKVSLSEEQVIDLKRLHLKKMEMSDRIYVVTDGRIGEGLQEELDFAEKLEIPISWILAEEV